MAFVDVTLKKENRTFYDLDFVDGDLAKTDGFGSALKMSILCERRAEASEVPSPSKRRGWWGNEALDIANFEIGSKLWLLNQARSTNVTLNRAVTYSQDATQWFVDDTYLDKVLVSSEYSDDTTMNISINLIRGQDKVLSMGFRIWENTLQELIE